MSFDWKKWGVLILSVWVAMAIANRISLVKTLVDPDKA